MVFTSVSLFGIIVDMGTNAYTAGTLTKALAGEITKIRKEQGLSVLALANKCGIPQSTLDKLLKSKRPFTVEHLDMIASSLGVKPSTLMIAADHARRTTPPVASLDSRRKMSEGLPIFDPIARGLAAKRDERDDDTEQ